MVRKGQLRKLLDEGDIDSRDVAKCYDDVKQFYIAAFTHCTKWLPLDNPLLKNGVFIDFNERNKCSMDNVEGVLSSLGHIHRKMINNPRTMDTFEKEFLVYQAMSEADIRVHIWEESKVVEKLDDNSAEAVTYHRLDIIWGSLQEKLPNLSKVALAVLIIPHSNAGEERVFSVTRRNKTDFYSNLDLQRSLSSIMTIKMNKPEKLLPCPKFKPSNNLLTKCKVA